MPGGTQIIKNPRILLRLINKIKEDLKKNDVFKKICKDNNVSVDVIDLVPVKFGPLEVSARTENGLITLKDELLKENRFHMIPALLLHEMCHSINQCFGDGPTIGANEMDYLKNPDEVEPFSYQLEYMADKFGPAEADRYAEHLLNHHDKKGPEREQIKDKLMDKVDD